MDKNQIKLQKQLRENRNNYLIDIIGQFKESEENQNIFNCYDYVKTVTEVTKDDFIESLSESGRNLIRGRFNVWFLPIESLETFTVFLSINKIEFK